MGIMKRLRKPIIVLLVLVVGFLLWYFFIAAGERVTFYQTYGYKEGDNWVIPIHLRVWERGLVERGEERLIARAAEGAEQLTGESMGGFDLARFRARLGAFVADDESGQNVVIGFDKDPQAVRYPITSLADGREVRSDRNGRIDGRIQIPLAAAAELMRSQESAGGLLCTTQSRAAIPVTGRCGCSRTIPPPCQSSPTSTTRSKSRKSRRATASCI